MAHNKYTSITSAVLWAVHAVAVWFHKMLTLISLSFLILNALTAMFFALNPKDNLLYYIRLNVSVHDIYVDIMSKNNRLLTSSTMGLQNGGPSINKIAEMSSESM